MPTDTLFTVIANPKIDTHDFVSLFNPYFSTHACGFSIIDGCDESVLAPVLCDLSIKKIVLYRSNFLALIASEVVAANEQSQSNIDHLAFIHIPKTAGLSLHAVLESHFGKQASYRAGNVEERDQFLKTPSAGFRGYSYITGHLSLRELLDKGIDFASVAVVRNPLERLVSLLGYQRKSSLSEHKDLKFDRIESFVEHMTRTGQFNMQCWHLSGTHKFEDAVEMIHRHHIYVAPLEYYDDFLSTLSGLLGSQLENVRVNVTPKGDPITLTDSDRQLLEPLIGEDMKLVEYIKENYDRLKNDFIENSCSSFDAQTSCKLVFDRKIFEQRLLDYQSQYRSVLDVLNETNQHYLFMTYEELQTPALLRRVFQFLGLSPSLIKQVRTNSANCRNIISLFENPEEVRAYLSETGRLNWAYEGFMTW